MNGRGQTRTGYPSAQPGGHFDPPPPVASTASGLSVAFHGEDGRQASYLVSQLPMPGWHPVLAAGFAEKIGPAGTVRTLASAAGYWAVLQRFVRYLNRLSKPPARPHDLTVDHVTGYEAWRRSTVAAAAAAMELHVLVGIFQMPAIAAALDPDTLEVLARRRRPGRRPGRPGYSDRELAALVRAAREDAAQIRNRISNGEKKLAAGRPGGDDLNEAQDWDLLAAMATTGRVPRRRLPVTQGLLQRLGWAAQLHLIWPDLISLTALFIAVSGRNVETIKELPADHRLLGDRAVEVVLTKRRRGQGRWTETVTWEIGPPHRQLHTPGGLYLLIHKLTARSRALSRTDKLWSIWRNQYASAGDDGEHFNPFESGLQSLSPYLGDWRAGRDLTADHPHDHSPAEAAKPLRLDFMRLRTSIEVRRTRQLGGHLPSAARSNTTQVLFANYLRDDPTTIEWARGVMGEALLDAEQSALQAHQSTLEASSGRRQLTVLPQNHPGPDGLTEAAWTSCSDPTRHPATGTSCQATLLDCFHCGNCVVTHAHLPRLLALLDELNQRRQQLAENDWWDRYGSTWTAIRHDILAKFSTAEVEQATADKPSQALLDLIENPWERR